MSIKKYVAVLCAVITMGTMLTACGKEKQEEAAPNSDTSISSEAETVSEITPTIHGVTFENVTMRGGNFVYDLLFENFEDEIIVSNSDIVMPEGFTANAYIARDPSEPALMSVVFSGIDAEPGSYSITIKEQNTGVVGTFDIIVNSPEMSPWVQMNCTTSETEIEPGGTLTVLAKYIGVDSTKYLAINPMENFVKLYNCTGDFEFSTTNNGLDICIILRNIQATNPSQDCYLEIIEGSAKDGDGKVVNGEKIKFKVTA